MTSWNKLECADPDRCGMLVPIQTAHPLRVKDSTKGWGNAFEDTDCCWALRRGMVKMSHPTAYKIRRIAPWVLAGCPSHRLHGQSHVWVGQRSLTPVVFSHAGYTGLFIGIVKYNCLPCDRCAHSLLLHSRVPCRRCYISSYVGF